MSIKEIKRNQLKSVMDDFTSFSWGLQTIEESGEIKTIDLFDKYGAFIVGGKDGLKFYNGPSYSNEYTQPQFDKSAGKLTGVNFTMQKISFTMGVYWVTEQEYRELMYFLHPMKVDFLTFGFEPNYGYTAKLSKIADSTRHIIGRDDNELVYYTEIPLTFDVQGEQCAKGIRPYEWLPELNSYKINTINDFIKSDLSFPIECTFSFTPKSANQFISGSYKIDLVASYGAEDLTLFSVSLINITTNPFSSEDDITYNFKYKSDTGLLFFKKGDSDGDTLVTLQNLTDTGEKMIGDYICNKFFIPGKLEHDFNIEDLRLTLLLDNKEDNTGLHDFHITAYPRTNVI